MEMMEILVPVLAFAGRPRGAGVRERLMAYVDHLARIASITNADLAT